MAGWSLCTALPLVPLPQWVGAPKAELQMPWAWPVLPHRPAWPSPPPSGLTPSPATETLSGLKLEAEEIALTTASQRRKLEVVLGAVRQSLGAEEPQDVWSVDGAWPGPPVPEAGWAHLPDPLSQSCSSCLVNDRERAKPSDLPAAPR